MHVRVSPSFVSISHDYDALFSSKKHTHTTELHFFSRFLSPNFGSCTFACFGSPCASSLSFFSRYSCWCSVIFVCCFFFAYCCCCFYVYDSTITLNNLVCCFSVSNGGCCFVPQRRGIRETRVGDDCCSTIALLLLSADSALCRWSSLFLYLFLFGYSCTSWIDLDFVQCCGVL